MDASVASARRAAGFALEDGAMREGKMTAGSMR